MGHRYLRMTHVTHLDVLIHLTYDPLIHCQLWKLGGAQHCQEWTSNRCSKVKLKLGTQYPCLRAVFTGRACPRPVDTGSLYRALVNRRQSNSSLLRNTSPVAAAFCCDGNIIRLHRSTTYIDAAYCYRPSSAICWSVTLVSPANTAEPTEMPFGSIEMTFGLRILVGSGIMEGPDLPMDY